MNYINNQINDTDIKQTTLSKKLIFTGIGIHNGRAVDMSIEPAEVNTGIVFERIDLKNNNLIKAKIENVQASSLCTKITNKYGVSVSTIEHLMATFNGLNIDNVKVKINSSELPAMDGSSSDYTKKVMQSGIQIQSENRKYLKIKRKVIIREGNRYISASPSSTLSLDLKIDYPNTIVGNDQFLYEHSKENFIENICKARTFAFSEDIQKMRASGLAIGGNLNNAIVVDKFKIVNSSGLRVEKEFVKHKVLDCLGDFYLLGIPILGKIECFAPGHRLNQNFINEILKDKNNYQIINQSKNKVMDGFYNILTNGNTSENELV